MYFFTYHSICRQVVINLDNIPEWQMRNIALELEPFSSGIKKQDVEATWQSVQNNSCLVRFIIDGKNVRYLCPEQTLCHSFEYKDIEVYLSALKIISQSINLPYIDFIVLLSDGFTGNSEKYNFQVPVFAYSKNQKFDKRIITVPHNFALDPAHQKSLETQMVQLCILGLRRLTKHFSVVKQLEVITVLITIKNIQEQEQ